jgi:hypothetical protein
LQEPPRPLPLLELAEDRLDGLLALGVARLALVAGQLRRHRGAQPIAAGRRRLAVLAGLALTAVPGGWDQQLRRIGELGQVGDRPVAGVGQTVEQLAARLAKKGRAVRLTTVQRALDELAAAGLVAPAGEPQSCRWSSLPASHDPLLDAVELHGSHDFRHTFATWLEDAGVPARVIDEVMGHEATGRGDQGLSSAMGAHYRQTTPEMAARVITAIEARLAVVLSVAEKALEIRRTRSFTSMF